MNLDNLKALWQEHHAIAELQNLQSPEYLREQLKKRSQNSLHNISRNATIELWIGVALLVVATTLSFVFLNRLSVNLMVFFSSLGAITWLNYWYLNRRILRKQAKMSLKKYLKSLIHRLELYFQIYYYTTLGALPLGFFSGYIFGAYASSPTPDFDLYLIILMAVLFVPITLFFRYFTKYCFRIFYGQYLDNLKNCLEELETN
jgi:uncharacterized membrane protein YbjE (DUF340 family)